MKRKSKSGAITNRRARFDYALDDAIVAGIMLTGAETKALRLNHGQLNGAYVTVKDSAKGGELWLVNATITGTNGIPITDSDTTRTRKLLVHSRQLKELVAAKQRGETIVPLEILTKGRYIKLRIAAGRGRKKYDKREVLKKRDQDRAIRQSN